MKSIIFLKITTVLILTFIGIVGSNIYTIAAEKKSKSIISKKQNTETLNDYVSKVSKKYTNADIDINRDGLPLNYGGIDYKYLYDSIYIKYLKIDEYENTSDYIKRINKDKIMWENKIFAIMLQEYDGNEFPKSPYTMNYNPENKRLSLNTNTQVLANRLKFRHDEFNKIYEHQYDLDIENRGIINPESLDSMITVSFSMEPNLAKQNYDNIRILLICKFPSIDSIFKKINNNSQVRLIYELDEKDKITSPEMIAKHYFKGWKTQETDDSGMHILKADVLEVWIYNIKTGEIYYKKKYVK